VLLNSNKTLTFGSETGALYVTNGTNTGQLYDTYFNPVSTISGISTLQSHVTVLADDTSSIQFSMDAPYNTPGSTTAIDLIVDSSQNAAINLVGGSSGEGLVRLG
jgi:hypothetical protein